MRHSGMRYLATLLLAAGVLFALAPARSAQAQTAQRCFNETGFCISGSIRAYWERSGGLAVFGFPISAQGPQTVEGRNLQVQWFQRDRLEIQADGSVTAGRLGAQRLDQLGTPFQQGPGGAAGPGCQTFAQTGYQVCGAFLTYWQRSGGLARFGYPITGSYQTTIEGQSLTVQYFERRRFELHGANQVLLGLLGSEVLNNQGDAPAPAPQPQPQPQPPAPQPGVTPLPPAQDAIARPDRGPRGTRFVFAARGFDPKERVGVYITLPDGEVFGAPFQVSVTDDGVTDAVTFTVPNSNDVPTGIWAITFEGVDSGHKGIAYFEVTQ